MNILILGKDPTLFESRAQISDTLKRHQNYLKQLQQQQPGSSIRIVSYTPRRECDREKLIAPDLILYPTRSFWRVLFVFDLLRLLPRILKNWKPDLITVQEPWEEGLAGLYLSRKLGVPFLPQLHFDLFSGDWLKEKFSNRLKKLLAGFVLKRASAVRAVSSVLADKIQKNLGLSRERIWTVPVAVEFPVQRPGISNNPPQVLFVGRLVAQKNLPLWLEVAGLVHAQLPQVRFVVAGSGPLEEFLKHRIAGKTIAQQFEFLGAVSYEKLPAVYARARVLLLTSHYEGYGRVLVEAYLSGIPAVATRCTGPEDLIVDGQTGFLLERDDAPGLAQAILRVLQDEKLALGLAQKGQEWMLRQFSAEILTQKLIQCWLQVAA